MSGKTFHLRANEVRAEAQALMQKLRAERFAASRAGKRVLRLRSEQVVAAVVPPPAPPSPNKIVVSRKIKAAVVAPPSPPVEPETAATVTPAETPSPETAPPAIEVKKPRPHRAKKVAVVMPEVTADPEPVVGPVPTVVEPVVAHGKVIEAPVAELAPEMSAPRSKKVRSAKPRKPKAKIVEAVEELAADVNPVASMQEALAESVTIPAEKPASGRAQMPISLVPSLGPGMIWRLNQLGLHTLHDLAEVSPDELRSKLGPVARLVRVENWIDFARAT
jgi:hypothetical protein